MKKNNLILAIAVLSILTVAAFKVTNAESTTSESGSKNDKSVAWFVANTKEARNQNQECHDNPSIQSTPNCVNALHALKLSFSGGNGRR